MSHLAFSGISSAVLAIETIPFHGLTLFVPAGISILGPPEATQVYMKSASVKVLQVLHGTGPLLSFFGAILSLAGRVTHSWLGLGSYV